MSAPAYIYPLRLFRQSGCLLGIEWSDGETRQYRPQELRSNCPCATCRTAGERPSPPADLDIREMSPVGNYGYKIAFSDGHTTGIFPLELLRSLGAEG